MKKELFLNPHKRYNPLTNDWVLVSPHRLERPWQGKVESIQGEKRPSYDPKCYLCPGNSRAGNKKNPQYKGTYVFENDFAALLPDIPKEEVDKDSGMNSLLQMKSERGVCRVLCFSPRHDLTLAEMEEKDILIVINLWVKEYIDLGKKDLIRYVQIFENKGQLMGCSNPHPHGQIWATETLPLYPSKEDQSQKEYFQKNKKKCLLCDYLKVEKKEKVRIVCENENWVIVVPFWAIWPYETLLLSKRHIGNFTQMENKEKKDLANILKQITIRYDNLFQVSFPYSMGFHQNPTDEKEYPYWHFHGHFYPPLLRSAKIQKFMVGFEMLGTPQRDITAEQAAEKLRSLSEMHYRKRG